MVSGIWGPTNGCTNGPYHHWHVGGDDSDDSFSPDGKKRASTPVTDKSPSEFAHEADKNSSFDIFSFLNKTVFPIAGFGLLGLGMLSLFKGGGTSSASTNVVFPSNPGSFYAYNYGPIFSPSTPNPLPTRGLTNPFDWARTNFYPRQT